MGQYFIAGVQPLGLHISGPIVRPTHDYDFAARLPGIQELRSIAYDLTHPPRKFQCPDTADGVINGAMSEVKRAIHDKGLGAGYGGDPPGGGGVVYVPLVDEQGNPAGHAVIHFLYRSDSEPAIVFRDGSLLGAAISVVALLTSGAGAHADGEES